MIPSWRQVWHTRTGGITDINFPFGFVQVRLVTLLSFGKILFLIIYSYQPTIEQALLLADFHGFDGIKLLVLVMYRMMSFRIYSWQLLWIYVMMMEGK
jgi:hypothetical protein